MPRMPGGRRRRWHLNGEQRDGQRVLEPARALEFELEHALEHLERLEAVRIGIGDLVEPRAQDALRAARVLGEPALGVDPRGGEQHRCDALDVVRPRDREVGTGGHRAVDRRERATGERRDHDRPAGIERERGIDDRLAAGDRDDHRVDALVDDHIDDLRDPIATRGGRRDVMTGGRDRVAHGRDVVAVFEHRERQRLERRQDVALAHELVVVDRCPRSSGEGAVATSSRAAVAVVGARDPLLGRAPGAAAAARA